ncbi:MAG: radical SAM protein [Bryobacteraceae bacterium]
MDTLFQMEPAPSPVLIGIAKMAASAETLEAKRKVQYRDLPTRNWITRCVAERMPFAWTINPYRGCEFGCKYCYARYTHEFMELHGIDDFETQIYAKHWHAPSFAAELRRLDPAQTIAIGTATDPYQPAERRYGLTRKMLTVFAQERGRRIFLITKSDLITRDIDLFQQIAAHNRLGITVTITTTDAALARLLEPMAPRPALRLKAIQGLSEAGLTVSVNANPVIPMITDSETNLDRVAAAAARAGAVGFHGGLLFLKPCAQRVFFPFLEAQFPKLVKRYHARYAKGAYLKGEYPKLIQDRVQAIRKRYGLDRNIRAWEGEQPQSSEQLSLY